MATDRPASGGPGNGRGRKGNGGAPGGGKLDGAAKLEALASVLKAFTSVCDTITTVSANRTQRARIVADSAESVREYELRRDALKEAIGQTFAERNRTLDEYFRHLDDAMRSGDLEKAHVMTSNITDVVKSGPLKGLADLRSSMLAGSHSFSIGDQE